MFAICAVVMMPPEEGNQMSFVGSYSYNGFAGAPLQVGDLAVYIANFPGTGWPTGGSGDDWTEVWSYIATKVIEAGDIGVKPTNNDPTRNADARFLIYRGPSSLTLIDYYTYTPTYAFTPDAKHCGMLIMTETASGQTLTPDGPAAWANRRSQTSTWSGTPIPNLKIWDRLQPANAPYLNGQDVTISATGPTVPPRQVSLFEFRVP